MIRKSDAAKYERSRKIYRLYIERDKIKPTKARCNFLYSNADYRDMFVSENSMETYTKTFYKGNNFNSRQLPMIEKIMDFYKKFYH